MYIRNALLALVALALAHTQVRADELTADKRADIEQLTAISNSAGVSNRMAALFISQWGQLLKEARPDLDSSVMDIIEIETMHILEENMAELMQQLIPIYDKYLTAADVKDTLHFYASDIGKKWLRVAPEISQDSLLVGQRWGQSLVPLIERRIRQKLREKNIDI